MRWNPRASFAALVLLAACSAATTTAPAGSSHVRVVLSPEPVEQRILSGPPQTAGMRAGRVVLLPGKEMHRHSTGKHEELLVFLAGEGKVFVGSEPVVMEAGQVLYIPPGTEHEVRNDGAEELRYIYCVTPAAGGCRQGMTGPR